MKKINVSKAQPGMILGKDVINKDGRLLYPVDTPIAQKEIRTLKMWGISEIIIQQQIEKTVLPDDLETPQTNTKAIEFLDQWFAHNDRNHPVIEILYDICMQRFINHQFDESIFVVEKEKDKGIEETKIQPVKDIHRLLYGDFKLPSLPTIFSEINAAIKDPKCSGKDIADIVSKDPSLSATLLKIVNSAYYGLSERVESLHFAAMVLGSRQVSSLALGITVVNYFKGISNLGINMESFWRHSVGCGIAAKSISTHMKNMVPDRVFIGGLLHDIGRLVFLNRYPEQFDYLFKKAQFSGEFLSEIEAQIFGMNHARFGSLMTKSWNFSERISQMIRLHHDEFVQPSSKEVALINFSNWLVNAIGLNSSVETLLPCLDKNAWDALEIPESTLESIIKQIDRQIVEVVKYFYE